MKTYAFQDPCTLGRRCSSQVEAYYSRSWDHYDMDPHFHDRIEIMYVSKGSALIHLYQYRADSGNRKIQITTHRTERLTAEKYRPIFGKRPKTVTIFIRLYGIIR